MEVKIKDMMIKKVILLVLLISLSGCTIAWNKQLTVGAKGAKTKAYGKLESGELLYKSNWYLGLGCKK